ncbi:cytochrome o ubiquinol oxidase subunit II [Buchnera aphidicola]|uniref:cytochrome o ubiquinol oxidase subunit II n=1 Tax=Buchnera aphidicola TaxID=9 RepID=UPI0030EC6178
MKIFKIKNFFFKCFFCIWFFLYYNNFAYSQGLFSPKGFFSYSQISLFYTAFFTMLILIIPVILLVLLFLWVYKYNIVLKKYSFPIFNQKYSPNWNHSYKIEFFSWGISIIIIFFLAILSWKKTHELDPKKYYSFKKSPIFINVVSIDWKWIFIFPKEKIISVNELCIPINTPIVFNITSNSSMNSFFIPQLGSQVYAMPGMITKLNLIANSSGIFKGISSNYSGSGFSNMKFKVFVTSRKKNFLKWVNKIRNSKNFILNVNDIKNISKNNNEKYFYYFSRKLFNQIVKSSK